MCSAIMFKKMVFASFFLSSRKYLIQAMSEEDRKSWLEIMEGKEPVYSSLKVIECKYSAFC